MNMDFATLSTLRKAHPAWRLLVADHAPLIAGFLHRVFIVPNARVMAQEDHITSQKYGTNALGLHRVLDLGCYETAWQWLHKLRRAMVRPRHDQLSRVVQVDETFVGDRRKPGKRGRGAAGKALNAGYWGPSREP